MPLPSVEGLEGIPDPVCAALREALERNGFIAEAIERTHPVAPGAVGAVRLPLVRDWLGSRSEPGLRLALLLTYGGVLARSEVERLLEPATAGVLLEAGVFAADGAQLRCPFRMVPIGGLRLLGDNVLDLPDSVMPPGPTTQVIGDIMPGRCPPAVLDVGCGPGSLALAAAARGAARVVGTDINPRAVTMARFNARLNGLAAEFRVGNVLEPVRGERFDLIVSQPPFVMRPDDVPEVRFLHGGPRGDSVMVELMAGVAAALTPGGEALVLCDFALREGEEIGPVLSSRLGPSGLDLLVLHVAGLPPEGHALVYAKHGVVDVGEEYLAEVRRYLAHLEKLGIRSFRHALVVARRAAPDARDLSLTPLPVREIAAATSPVRERLWAAAVGSGRPDPDLLSRRVRVAPGAEWISLRNAPEGEQREHRVRFGPEWPALEQIVTDEGLTLAALLERSDTVAEAVAGYAEACECEPAEVRAPLLAYIRQSLLGGMLVFEEDGHAV